MPQSPGGFESWIATVASDERSDPIWRMRSFRLARYIGCLVAGDADIIQQSSVGVAVADQLLRAVHSIAANLAEGYSRGSGADRVRLFEYALGSAREALVWYAAAERALPPSEAAARVAVLTEIRRLLLTTIRTDRHRRITSKPQ